MGLRPGVLATGDAQVGNGEAHQASLGLGALAGGTLVTYLTTGTGGRTRIGCNGRGVVVGLNLHQDLDILFLIAVAALFGVHQEALSPAPLDHCRIVLVGGKHLPRGLLSGVADHLEQGLVLLLPIHDPVSIEDLVPAVLGIGLGEHHQLHIRGVAPQGAEALIQIFDLILGQGQAQFTVGQLQGRLAAADQINALQGCGLGMHKQALRLLLIEQHRFGHAVMQQISHRIQLMFRKWIASRGEIVGNATFQASNGAKATVMGNIGRLAGPGGDGAGAGYD